MHSSKILQLLLQGNQLKQMARTGWVQRGIPDAENVAAHSFGAAFSLLVLAQLIPQPIDLEKSLVMALLHDLPEGITTDIPTTAWRLFPPGIKLEVERQAMFKIVRQTPVESTFMTYWEELNRLESPEAKLVHDADKLDMYLQAVVYEQQTGNEYLEEFWVTPRKFFFTETQNIYEELVSLRKKE